MKNAIILDMDGVVINSNPYQLLDEGAFLTIDDFREVDLAGVFKTELV